jgi:hypothetical protein
VNFPDLVNLGKEGEDFTSHCGSHHIDPSPRLGEGAQSGDRMNSISQETQIDDKDLFPRRESHPSSFNERRGNGQPRNAVLADQHKSNKLI